MKQRKLMFSSLERQSFSRRAQGLPITTIIIAALGLIVLVIMVMMVQTQVTKTGRGLRNVTEAKCEPLHEIKPIGGCDEIVYGDFADVRAKPGFACCRKPTP